VLLFLANWEVQEDRLEVLHKDRARASDMLQALLAGAQGGGAQGGGRPGSGGGGGGGGGGASAGAGPSRQGASGDVGSRGMPVADEVVEELAALTSCERAILLLHAQVDWVIMTDLQRVCTMCASFPYPLHSRGVRSAMLHLLRWHADAFPWAGPPA
jgi:hypothetical protein